METISSVFRLRSKVWRKCPCTGFVGIFNYSSDKEALPGGGKGKSKKNWNLSKSKIFWSFNFFFQRAHHQVWKFYLYFSAATQSIKTNFCSQFRAHHHHKKSISIFCNCFYFLSLQTMLIQVPFVDLYPLCWLAATLEFWHKAILLRPNPHHWPVFLKISYKRLIRLPWF